MKRAEKMGGVGDMIFRFTAKYCMALNMASWFTRVYYWPLELITKKDQPVRERLRLV